MLIKKNLISIAIISTVAPLAQLVQSAQLEEIVVTATKRSESLQEVPLAVSAISSEALKKGGIFETTDLNRAAPNLQVSSPYGTQQPNFSIRGVGVGTEFNANAASPIGVYVDEVYQTFRASHGQQLYDLEQIEVVRGPQGTLYGRNTTGGAINFITRAPDLEDSNGYITVGYGNYERKNVAGAYEFTPSEGRFGVRIAGSYTDTDNYTENRLPAGLSTQVAGMPSQSGMNYNTGLQPGGMEDWGLRATFRFLPTDDIDLSMKIYAAESEGGTEAPVPTGTDRNSDVYDFTNPNFLLAPVFTGLNTVVPGILPESYSPSERGLGVRDIEADTISPASTETQGVVFRGEFTVNENLKFIGVAGYDEGEYSQLPYTDCDGTPYRLCAFGYYSDFEAYNIDLRLDYQNGPLKVIAGAFYGYDEIYTSNRPDFFNFFRDVNAFFGVSPGYFNPAGSFAGILPPTEAGFATGITAIQNYEQQRDSWAFYTEANYEITESVNITFGLRYSDDTLEISDGYTTYYDDTGVARMLSVSQFNDGNLYQPYFLQGLTDIAGNPIPGLSADDLNSLFSGGGDISYPDPRSEEGKSDSVSGRIILDWQVTDQQMVYASYSRGYRSGTMNGQSYTTGNQIYFVPPEEVDAYEIGFKTRWLDERLQINGAVFLYDYQGQQGQIVDSSATANLVSLDGEITGLEVDMLLAVTDTLTLTAAFGMLDSEYDNSPCNGSPTGFPPQQGNCVSSAAGAVDIGGNPFPYAAEETFNTGFDWDIAEIAEGIVTLHADAAYTGQFHYDSFEDYSEEPLPTVASGKMVEGEGDYWTYNARLSFSTESYGLALWGKNLSDEEYYPFGIALEGFTAGSYRVIAPPRTYGVEFTYKF